MSWGIMKAMVIRILGRTLDVTCASSLPVTPVNVYSKGLECNCGSYEFEEVQAAS